MNEQYATLRQAIALRVQGETGPYQVLKQATVKREKATVKRSSSTKEGQGFMQFLRAAAKSLPMATKARGGVGVMPHLGRLFGTAAKRFPGQTAGLTAGAGGLGAMGLSSLFGGRQQPPGYRG